MNYTKLFAKGGKIDTKVIKSEIARIFMLEDSPEKVEQLWQDAVNTYGSEEGVLSEIFKQVGDNPSDESVQKAMMNVLNYTPMEESQMFKCGGKLQQLVTKFGKGGGVDCGCGGIKLETGGPAKVGEYNKEDFFNDRGAWETVHLPNGDVGYARNYRPRAFRFGPVTKNLNQVLITYDENGTPRASSREIKGFFNPNRVKLDTTYNTANNTRASKDFIDRMNFALEGVAPERPQSKQEGGTVELTPLPGHDVDTRLTRRQARDLAALNQGYNGEQFQYAMDNAVNVLRKQGLRGRELRERAREMAAGINPTERSIASAPTALNTTSTIASPAEIIVPKQLILPETQRTLDTMLDRTNTTLTKNLNRSKVTVKPSDEYIRKGNNPILSYQDFNRQPGYTRRSDGQPLSYQDFTQQLGDVYVTANKSGYNKKGNEPVSSYNNFIEQLPEAQVFGSNLPEVYVTADRSRYNSLPNRQSVVSYQDFRQQLPNVTVTPTENGILLPEITKYGYRNVQTPVPMSKCGGKVESAKCGCKATKGQWGMSIIHPKVVKDQYDKIDNALTPARKYEQEHGTKVIGGLGLPALVAPFTIEPAVARIPAETSLDQRAIALIKAEAEKQKAINAATKAGKFYVEPRPNDLDIDKLPMFEDKIIKYIKNTKLTK